MIYYRFLKFGVVWTIKCHIGFGNRTSFRDWYERQRDLATKIKQQRERGKATKRSQWGGAASQQKQKANNEEARDIYQQGAPIRNRRRRRRRK